MTDINYRKGFLNKGDTARIKKVMARAMKGEPITVAFLGGSITHGSLASSDKTCYAYRVYEWWQKTFECSKVTYVNAGVGGTGSDNGAARVDEHVLLHRPDFILTEFCVNDGPTAYYKETFEGLVRHILNTDYKPALMLLNNARYDNSESAESIHLQTEKHYDVPTVSVKHSICPLIEAGDMAYTEVSPDGLHPNDYGHSLVAGLIIKFLEDIYKTVTLNDSEYEDTSVLPKPLTRNTFESAHKLCALSAEPVLKGFVKDDAPKTDLHSVYGNGFTAQNVGDFIEFEAECESLCVQYIKTVKKLAPIAVAVVDGDTEHAVTLDANFTEDWGDCLCTVPLLLHGERKLRKVKISITEGGAQCVPFYLVSVITAVKP